MSKRIGIYAGTFDPVHAGHIAFALQAARTARLDAVYLLPERRPRGKHHVTHFAHRVAMVRKATKPHDSLDVLELVDKHFSVQHTLPRLEQRFEGAELVLICGSDVLQSMATWPRVETLLTKVELCVGRRGTEVSSVIDSALQRLPVLPRQLYVVNSHAPAISSSQIRSALREGRMVHGLLESVKKYAREEWLYL